MQIRKAQYKDVQQMMYIVKQAQHDLKEMNVDQWQNGYPNDTVLHQDIDLNKAYVAESDHVLGLMVISYNDETTYDPLTTWIKSSYMVIHRFVVEKEVQRTGVASYMVHQASMMAKELQMESIRIDTHEKNVRMRRFLEKLGFEERGIIYLKDGNPRVAYELILI